jgi:hypothetical protein
MRRTNGVIAFGLMLALISGASIAAPNHTPATPNHTSVANKEQILYWLIKRGEVSADASDSVKQAAINAYIRGGRPIQPPVEHDRTKGCLDISPQFQNLQYKKFSIPADSTWSECLLFKDHTDEVGLLFERGDVDEYSQSYIDIIPHPYRHIGTTKKDQYTTIKVKPAPKRRTVINLSAEAGVVANASIAARFSVTPAPFDREMVIFYELAESGTTLAGITIAKTENSIDSVTSDTSTLNMEAPKNYQDSTNRIKPELNSIAQVASNKDLYTEGKLIDLSPESKFSTAQYILPCMDNMKPPENINSTGRSLNKVLSDVELHRGSYYANKPREQKLIDKFLAIDDNNSQAHASAIAATAYMAAQRYRHDRKSYSFALGAAEQLAPSGPIISSMLQALMGDVDNSEYNKGTSYTRNVYLKDNNRRSVKDSCSRIAETTDEADDYPFCMTPFREFNFNGLTKDVTVYEAYPFNYGEYIDLTFDIDTINMADDVWVIAVGGKSKKAHRVYSRERLDGFDSFKLTNYSTKNSGGLYINVRSREYNGKFRSAVKVKIYCTPVIKSL